MNPKDVVENAVNRAALKWCSQKEREASLDDVQYFRNNWKSLPGLKTFVDAELQAMVGDGK